MISKLDVTNGIAGFLLANGALNDSDEVAIRQKILENDKVEAIIVLPRDMFYTTDISVTLWIVNNNKKAKTLNGRNLRNRTDEVLFIDLRTWNDHIEEYLVNAGAKTSKKKKVVLSNEQISKVRDIYFNWQDKDTSKYQDIPELCKSVNKSDITAPNFSLAPSNYIEFIDRDLGIDYKKEMARIQTEMKVLMTSEELSQSMLKDAFRGIGYGIE